MFSNCSINPYSPILKLKDPENPNKLTELNLSMVSKNQTLLVGTPKNQFLDLTITTPKTTHNPNRLEQKKDDKISTNHIQERGLPKTPNNNCNKIDQTRQNFNSNDHKELSTIDRKIKIMQVKININQQTYNNELHRTRKMDDLESVSSTSHTNSSDNNSLDSFDSDLDVQDIILTNPKTKNKPELTEKNLELHDSLFNGGFFPDEGLDESDKKKLLEGLSQKYQMVLKSDDDTKTASEPQNDNQVFSQHRSNMLDTIE